MKLCTLLLSKMIITDKIVIVWSKYARCTRMFGACRRNISRSVVSEIENHGDISERISSTVPDFSTMENEKIKFNNLKIYSSKIVIFSWILQSSVSVAISKE